MKFRCPKCQQPCGLFSRACPRCGFALTVSSLSRLATERMREATAVECPRCRQGVLPFGAKLCPVCGAPPMFQDATRATVGAYWVRLQRYFERVPPYVKRRAQWMFLLFSAALLWWMLGEVERQTGGNWYGAAALSVIHMAAIGFLTVWLMPRRILFAISFGATGKVKLALALNFFTGMLLLQLVIKVWWARTTLLATIFVVLWVAARLLNRYVLPEAWQTYGALFGSGNEYDTTSPQGRSAKLD